MRGGVDAAGADRLPLPAGSGGSAAARGNARAALGPHRLARAWPRDLDGGRNVRRRGRPGARRDPHAARRLARDLRLPGACRPRRARRRIRVARPSAGRPRRAPPARGERRARARLRRARRRAFPRRSARDHRLGADADRGGSRRQRATARRARCAAADERALGAARGGGRRRASRRRAASRWRSCPRRARRSPPPRLRSAASGSGSRCPS